jgi:hypothetical protein
MDGEEEATNRKGGPDGGIHNSEPSSFKSRA